MNRLEKAKALRADPNVHYNCCQSVLIPFAAETGLTEEQSFALGMYLNAGMRHGSVCGALTGAMMALGAMGRGEEKAKTLLQRFGREHGCTDCAHLLAAARERGEERKPHCDGLVYEMIAALEDVLEGGGA